MPASHNPPDYFMPCLFSIEEAVLHTYQQHTRLRDKDVEDIYDKFKTFFLQLGKGKELYEPSSTHPARQVLIDAILQSLDAREELGADDHLILSEDYQPGGAPIPNLETLYARCFNYLRGSVRFWRKERGPAGYLKFISEQLGKIDDGPE